MKYFVVSWLTLVPLTSYAKSPCRPPPNQATSVISEGKAETQSDTVVLTQADYARLYEFYNRCLLARSGTVMDWELFLRRADEAQQAATVNVEHRLLLEHLEEIEKTRQGLQAAKFDQAAALEQIRNLELIVIELQAQVAKPNPVPDTEALAEAK